MKDILSLAELTQLLTSPMLAEEASVVTGQHCLVVDLREEKNYVDHRYSQPLSPCCPIIGLTSPGAHPTVSDNSVIDMLASGEDDLAHLLQQIAAQPVAATTLVQVLRHNARTDIEQGLLTESLAYSTLQHSAGFRLWRNQRIPKVDESSSASPLLIHREQDKLTLTFNRPEKHNAYNEALKDALCGALQMAVADVFIKEIRLQGAGPSFCAGGDLSEFGRANDAGIAHLSRSTRGAGFLLATLSRRSLPITITQVQGACIGAGIELPAFTQHIAASADAFFQLPEVAMGLIPGAGGTVSVLRRIGRLKTGWLALSDRRIDAQTALSWGLIDEITPE